MNFSFSINAHYFVANYHQQHYKAKPKVSHLFITLLLNIYFKIIELLFTGYLICKICLWLNSQIITKEVFLSTQFEKLT